MRSARKKSFNQETSEQSSQEPVSPEMIFQNNAHKLVFEMTQKVGDMDELRAKKDVSYTYTYITPDGQMDVVEEKYIFDREKSYGKYIRHDRSLASLDGVFEQGYNGDVFWLRHKGDYVDDAKMMKRVMFNRKTNFYWFTMMQKLTDPGLNYEYFKEAQADGYAYDVVNITFESDNAKPTDIYQLWINQETKLVDQFLFTVVDFKSVDEPNIMKLEYETVDGIMIPCKRKYSKANWEAESLTDKWILVEWSDITFDSGMSATLFEKS